MPARQVRQGRAQMAASMTEGASEGMDPALPQRTFLKRKQPSPPAKDVSEKAFPENSLFRNVLWDGRRHGPATGDGEGRRRRGSSGAARGGWHGDSWAEAAGRPSWRPGATGWARSRAQPRSRPKYTARSPIILPSATRLRCRPYSLLPYLSAHATSVSRPIQPFS